MASLAAHAITIETDDGLGNPVAYTNTAVGVDSGVFYLITDRFGLDGSLTIAGDTSRTVWYEGILVKDHSSFSPSRSIDIVESGALSTASSFAFSIVNTAAFWSTLESNAVYLARCRVTYYYVSSTDGITFTFAKRWTGIIDEITFSETSFTARCIDNYKDIFTTLPSRQVDSSSFPDAIKESLGKAIPIVLGRVAYSPMVNVSGRETRETLCRISDVDHKVCAVKTFNATTKTMGLFTRGVEFSADDSRLVGRYIAAIKGGPEESIKILSNTATDTGTETTTVTLDEWWGGEAPVNPVEWDITTDDATVWYFGVRNYPSEHILSTKSVGEFIRNSIGIPAVYSYNSDALTFIDVSETTLQKSLSNISSSGYPGIKILSTFANSEGAIRAYIPIVPANVIVSSATSYNLDGVAAAAGDECPNLCDRDDSTYHDFQATNGTATGGTNLLDLQVVLPENPVIKALSDLFILFDYEHRDVSISNPFGYSQRILPIIEDIYSRQIEKTLTTFSGSSIGTTFVGKNYLPGAYYNVTRDDTEFKGNRSGFSIVDEIENLRIASAYNTLIWGFGNPNASSTHQYILRLKEIGLIGVVDVNVTRETLYASVIGEVFGTRWRSPDAPSTNRKTSADPIYLIGDVIEHLIRNYDYNHSIWLAAQAVVVGERRRPVVDNGWIYICTVAGTTHASVEPTWPTTLTSTVTDGTVTWKALDTLKIHCDSFDTIAAQRFNWYVGRALTDKKESLDYYRELARHGFLGIYMDTQGRVKVKSWVDNRTPSVTFSSSNILAGTLSEISLTPLRRIYNDFTIRYDWNPASGSFNKQIVVTRVDEPAFPDASQVVSPGTALPTFEVGLLDDGAGNYRFDVIFDSAHGLSTGDYVSLVGNADGYDFPPTAISVNSADRIFVTGSFTAGMVSTSGTCYLHADSRLKWKTFVGGVQSYGSAKGLWEQCHGSYVVSKTVQKLPADLGDCYWFIDPDAKDPSGNSIWEDLAGAGDEHPAFYYAMRLADWVTWQKKEVSFEVANNSTHRALELLDPVYVNDAKLTGGTNKLGWIKDLMDIPGDEGAPDRIRMEVIFNPDQLASCNFVFDTQGAADTLTDTTGAADTLTDEAC